MMQGAYRAEHLAPEIQRQKHHQRRETEAAPHEVGLDDAADEDIHDEVAGCRPERRARSELNRRRQYTPAPRR